MTDILKVVPKLTAAPHRGLSMKKFVTLTLAGLVVLSAAACVGVGKGKGKAPAPAPVVSRAG
jgi:hypothetical protein